MERPHPERYVDAGHVAATVVNGHLAESVQSAKDSLAAATSATPRAVVGVGRAVVSKTGTLIRGVGLRFRRLAGRLESAVER
jgi:hypothetical protein